MSVPGTNRTSGDVRSSVAIGGKADMVWTANSVEIELSDIRQHLMLQ